MRKNDPYHCHFAIYNGNAYSMENLPRKEQLKAACKQVRDNVNLGYVVEPSGNVLCVQGESVLQNGNIYLYDDLYQQINATLMK